MKTWMSKYSLLVLFFISFGALGETNNLGIYLEANGNETSQNINYKYIPDKENYEHLYFGFGLSGVQSDEALERNDRKEIFPVNLILGLKGNYAISPYFELGVDLGDLVVDTISGKSTKIDLTGTLGISYKVKNINIYGYYKAYSIKFSESNSSDEKTSTKSFGLPGLGVSFEF